jgi:hypothetical protein
VYECSAGYSRELDKRRTLGIGALLTLIDLISMATGLKRPCHKPEKVITNNVRISSSGSYPRGTGWYSSLTPNA